MYNMLSHTNISVNALFTHADFTGTAHGLIHGSFMREIYAAVKTNTSRLLTVQFSSYQSAVVQIGDRGSTTTILRPGNAQRVDNVQVELEDRSVKITTADWEVRARSRVKRSILHATKCADGRCIIDIFVKPRFDTANATVAPHGLMGQSFDGDDIGLIGATDQYRGREFTTSAMGEGAIEGSAADYEMPDKFSADFKFSRFGKVFAAPRNVTAFSGVNIKTQRPLVEAVARNDMDGAWGVAHKGDG